MKKSFLTALAATCLLVSTASAQQKGPKVDPKRKPAVHAKSAKAIKATQKTQKTEAKDRQELRMRDRLQAKGKAKKAGGAFKLSKEQAHRQANKARKALRTAKAGKSNKKGG